MATGSRKVAGKTDVQEIARITEFEVSAVLGELTDETRFFAALENEALSRLMNSWRGHG
ncbi:hypothetical protein RX330_11915 [Bradyrhizobium sp. NDS-1]|uniref:hypothetical protein n=1 Tax=Bradyrhizobium sp. NDS-1 TaxID=3080014 RepID=UPI00293E016D|nr:hypothetical protein [Bradyrhizobium sp. NDS-1]WOH75725.1 hypothetical protein RX330_11915 [Bradyrhizobium sp. NDS-1]